VHLTGKWHDRAPGETRVRVRYDKFVSFYDARLASLVDSRRGKPREEHTLKPLSRADAQTKLAELEAALARPWDEGSGVDWASVVHVVVERYGERLEVLAHTLADGAGNASLGSSYEEIAFKARQQALIMLTPHFTTSDAPDGASKAWLTPVVERCAATHTRGLPTGLLTPQEALIRGAVEDVMQQICRRLARVFYLAHDIEVVEETQRNASSVVGAMRGEVADLMAWLDWTQVWVKCSPVCSTEVRGNLLFCDRGGIINRCCVQEICVVSSGGGRGPRGGGGGDRRNPKCVRRPNA
jgi:hypothetical protein